jgi:predicted metalloprotease with PDZ domain
MATFRFRYESPHLAVLCWVMAAVVGIGRSAHAEPNTNPGPRPASYHVKLLSVAPPKLAVTAELMIDGQDLAMETTRPADIPELDALGWPALISNLRASDAAGRPLAVTGAGKAGWKLAQPHTGRLTVMYEVDSSPLAARGWPAPREAVFADPRNIVMVGRSLFLTTRQVGPATVSFDLPGSWRAVTAWKQRGRSGRDYEVGTARDLVVNLLVFTQAPAEVVTARGFRLRVVPMGHWQPVRAEVRRVLGAVIPRLVDLMGFDERADYLVVLLPMVDSGGEAYRGSFALNVDVPPSRANSAAWGKTLAHEIFHYWNGWRLRGADYATSQWFQEGFTDYAADLSMVASGLDGPDDFARRLTDHVRNYQKLTTSLEAGGSRKGPPLYSGGALVAFSWDVLIRQATDGKRSLGDFLRELWRRTEGGQRPYEWRDLQAALEATAQRDWSAFFAAHIRGSRPLPLAEVLPLAGLRFVQAQDGAARVETDPAAPASAKSLWQALTRGR